MTVQKTQARKNTKEEEFGRKRQKVPASKSKDAPVPKNETVKKKKQDDSTTVYFIAIVLFFLSIYVFIAVISFFLNWKVDQSVAEWSALMVKNPVEAHNFAGRLGAILGNIFVGEWFGIFGLCVPVLMAIISFLMIHIKPRILRKNLISVVMLMVIGSVTASFLSPHLNGIFGSSLGGGYGLYLNEWLLALAGEGGTAVILLMLLCIWAAYTVPNIFRYISVFFGVIGNAFRAVAKALFTPSPKKVRPVVSKTPEDKTDENTAAPIIPDLLEQEEEMADNYWDEQERYEAEKEGLELDNHNDYLQDEEEYIERPATVFSNFTNDYSQTIIDRENLVLFDKEILDDDDDDMVLSVKEIPSAPANDIPVISEERSPEKVFEEENTDKHKEKERGNEIELLIESSSLEEKEAAFEVSVTDNAEINLNKLPEDEDLRIKTNVAESTDDIDSSVFDPTLELSRYKLPPVDLLENHTRKVTVTEEELYENKNRIVETLDNFNIKIDKIKATIGPTVTLYEIVPAPGVRISKIKNLEDDIALSLSALGIRIIAPIPGKGTIGIEVPNKNKEVVSMYSAIRSVKFQESDYELPVVLGRTIQNEDYVIDLTKMPHILVAGATGQGKSVGLNAIITSLLYKKHPAELKLILVDPKKVELTLYSHLEKHFLAKLPGDDEAIITDTQKVIYTLNSLCIEMDNRYDLLKAAKVRNIKEYNEKFTSRRLNPNKGHHFMPYFVLIIDEFADLIMTAGREIETPIARLAQLARAVGIHLVIATQRPTTNIITGVIKANFPARIAFRVSSMIDSRTILDQPGANQLIGRGDMLISTGNDMTRVQCAFVDTPEVERITEYIGKQPGYSGAYELPEYVPEVADKGMEISGKEFHRDGLFDEVARYVVTNQQGSASTIQRNFSIGFNRAGRIMDQLERAGIVGRQEGSKPRQVLISDIASLEVLLYDLDHGKEF